MRRGPTLLLAGLAACAAVGAAAPANAADTCPSYNPPNEMTLGGGTPQSAKLGTSFDTNLQVGFANTDGCQITTQLSGIAVTFSAPGGGPSGKFASSGSNAVLIGTDAQGNATAPQFTANMTPGGYLVTASSTYGSVTFSLVNTASGVASTLAPLSPASQSAKAGAHYPQPLQVKVLDPNGAPVEGASVTFAIVSDDAGAGASFAGGMLQATATSDESGIATSPQLTANSDVGRFTGTATVAGSTNEAAFSLDNLAAAPPAIEVAGGARQHVTVGRRFGRPLEAKLLDGAGKPLQGASVVFTLGGGGGNDGGNGNGGGSAGAGASFAGGASQATETTNAKGIAISPRIVANTVSGTFDATASTTGTTAVAVFELQNGAARPSAITAGVGATQSAATGSPFPIPLAAKVEDVHGNPVAGAVVTFSAPARGPSGRFHGGKRTVKMKTDATGVAIAPVFVADRTQGGYAVRATVPGAASPAAFGLVNRAAA